MFFYGKPFVNVMIIVAAFMATACTTVSAEEKARVIDKILKEDEPQQNSDELTQETADSETSPSPDAGSTPAVSEAASAETPPAPSETPSATSDVPSASAALAVGTSDQPRGKPDMPLRQTIARLPLPRGVNHSDFLQFTNAHADVLAPWQPLDKEWSVYAGAFAQGANASEFELNALKLRIQENFPRAHWLFVWGLQQTSYMLLGRSGRTTFLIDRQEDFLGRMSLLLFLATELQAASLRGEYRDTLKKFYKNANAKYFKRPLTDRPNKPEGDLRPRLNPTEASQQEGSE